MTKLKLKTIKEIESTHQDYGKSPVFRVNGLKHEIKKGAILWILHALKKQKNPYKAFMDFHNIIPEDLVQE